jgi:hypothetical protein
MIRSILLLMTCVSWLTAFPTSAAVISRDWTTPGDGLLTYDDVNQREWLDLSETALSSQFPGATQEARYVYVVEQTTTGGIFDGFRVAKSSDVVALAQSAGINTATNSAALNLAPTLALANLVSITHQGANGNKFAVGAIDEVSGAQTPARLSGILYTAFNTQAGLGLLLKT